MIDRSGDVVCDLHRAQGNEEHRFLGSASKLRSTISPSLASKPVATVLVVLPQNHSLGFPSLGLKIGSCGLVICLTKSPRWFLGFGSKIKWAMICRLCHKIDGRMKTVHDTRQDLMTCFTWK
jgi:hypothetical protein